LIAQHTNANVVVAKKRSNAVKFLTKNYNLDMIISDDGLQHYSMGRDLEIAVVEGVNRFGNGLFLPSGPLRESISRLKSVDIIINNGSRADGEVSSQLEAESYTNLLTSETKKLDYFKNINCYAVAGIGSSRKFL